jgi:hypothetical protein
LERLQGLAEAVLLLSAGILSAGPAVLASCGRHCDCCCCRYAWASTQPWLLLLLLRVMGVRVLRPLVQPALLLLLLLRVADMAVGVRWVGKPGWRRGCSRRLVARACVVAAWPCCMVPVGRMGLRGCHALIQELRPLRRRLFAAAAANGGWLRCSGCARG